MPPQRICLPSCHCFIKVGILLSRDMTRKDCANTDYEGHYQQMFYIIFALLTQFNIIVEQHTAKGRIDITLETSSAIYVMELKFNKSAQEALDQINAKRYDRAFALKDKEIVKVSLNFAVKDEVNTLEWVIE